MKLKPIFLSILILTACFACSEKTVEDESSGLNAVTVTDDGNGTVSADMDEAKAGTEVTVTAVANDGFEFAGWVITSGNLQIEDASVNPLTFTMPDAPVSLKATFQEETVPVYPITVTATVGGEVNYGARFPSSPTDLIERPAEVPEGSTVQLVQNAKKGYRFKEWNIEPGNIDIVETESGGGYTFIMPAEKVAVEAVFEEAYYAIVLDENIENGTVEIDAENPAQVQEGEVVELVAVPEEGYKFMGWDINGIEVNADNIRSTPYLFKMPGNDVTVSAKFSLPVENVLDEIGDPGFKAYVEYCMSHEQTITVNEYWYDENKTFEDEDWVTVTPVTKNYPAWDTNGDGNLSEEEAAAVTAIDVSRDALKALGLTVTVKSIDAEGYFSGIELIQASNQEIAEIDAGEFPVLKHLVCNYSGLKKLSVDKCFQLEKLFVEHNQLSELEIGKNKALYSLSCWDNRIISPSVIDISAMALKDGRFFLRMGAMRPEGWSDEYREKEDLPDLYQYEGETKDEYQERVNQSYGSVLAIMSMNIHNPHWGDVSYPGDAEHSKSVELIYNRNVGWVGW